MPLRVRHAKTSSVPDSADASLVQPSDWNADHPITSDGPGLVGRTAAGAGPVAEVSAADGRALLGLGTAATQPSTAFQPADAELSAIAGLASAADRVPFFTGVATAALATLTAFGRSLIAAIDAAAGRTALGLGTAATQNTGTSGATVPLLNGANTWGATQTFTGPNPQISGGEAHTPINPNSVTSFSRNANIIAEMRSSSATGAFAPRFNFYRSRGDLVSPEDVLNGDFVFGIQGVAYASGAWNNSSRIIATCSGSPGAIAPGRIELAVASTTQGAGVYLPGVVYLDQSPSFFPDSNAATDLGKPAQAWRDVFCSTLSASTSVTIAGNVAWHAGNQAQVQAGTVTGQLASWNNTAGRYEPVTLNTLTDAADDAAAATAGVAVGGLYRTGSILKTRIA